MSHSFSAVSFVLYFTSGSDTSCRALDRHVEYVRDARHAKGVFFRSIAVYSNVSQAKP